MVFINYYNVQLYNIHSGFQFLGTGRSQRRQRNAETTHNNVNNQHYMDSNVQTSNVPKTTYSEEYYTINDSGVRHFIYMKVEGVHGMHKGRASKDWT